MRDANRIPGGVGKMCRVSGLPYLFPSLVPKVEVNAEQMLLQIGVAKVGFVATGRVPSSFSLACLVGRPVV